MQTVLIFEMVVPGQEFVSASENAGIVGGPIGGSLNINGTWDNARPGSGRWSASASWLLVQLDRASLEEAGWTNIWKDAHSETNIDFSTMAQWLVDTD